MQLNTIARKTPNRRSISIGRGGKRGKTSGRGTKGQDSRSGHKKRPEIRDIIKKLPKLRGRGKRGAFTSYAERATPVSLSTIEKRFESGERVEPSTLADKGIIERKNGYLPRVKVLGGSEITKKLVVSGVEVSASAKAALEKAGGTVHA